MKNRRRFPGGTVEVRADVVHGDIRDIVFYGDFLSLSPLDGLTDSLRGVPFRREDVQAVLDRFPLTELFGSVTEEELLDLMFHPTA